MFLLPAKLVKEARNDKFSHTDWGLGMSQDIRCHIRSCDSVFVFFLLYKATAFSPSQPHATLSVSRAKNFFFYSTGPLDE